MMVYKGNAYVLGRSSESSNLYSMEDGQYSPPERLLAWRVKVFGRGCKGKPWLIVLLASMDSLDTFSVSVAGEKACGRP